MNNNTYILNRLAVVMMIMGGVASPSIAQNIDIQSISRNGSISYSGVLVGSTATVEWASSLTEPGRTNWHGLTNVIVTNTAMTSDIPMFFRVRGVPDTNGLIAYYPFNGDTLDWSGNSHDGVVYGVLPTSNRFGTASSAYAMGANGTYVLVQSSPAFAVTNLTIAAWVKPNDLGVREADIIFSSIQSALRGGGFQLYFAGLAKALIFEYGDANGNPHVFVCSTNICIFDSSKNNQWMHLAATVSSSSNITSVTLSMNGNFLQSTNMAALPPSYNGANIYIGANRDWASYDREFHGDIDEVRLYNRALQASEIQALYNLPL